MPTEDEILIEMSRLIRECEEAVRVKLASRQLGEAWKDLPVADRTPIAPLIERSK